MSDQPVAEAATYTTHKNTGQTATSSAGFERSAADPTPYTVHQMWSYERRLRGAERVAPVLELRAENLKGGDHLGDLDVDGRYTVLFYLYIYSYVTTLAGRHCGLFQ
jgi:hypothetical protein